MAFFNKESKNEVSILYKVNLKKSNNCLFFVLFCGFFFQIVVLVPSLVQTLKKENSGSSQTNLQTLAELMHCLMYQHTGFPELYGPVVDCLQVLFWKSNKLVGDVLILAKDTKSL